MAHFAHLDNEGYVDFVGLISNNECLDENGEENELKGISFCRSFWGMEGVWLQTSYNNRIRKNYAGIGYYYDASLDAFIPPKPYPSWVLDNETCQWNPPSPRPDDGKAYNWDEDSLSWAAL